MSFLLKPKGIIYCELLCPKKQCDYPLTDEQFLSFLPLWLRDVSFDLTQCAGVSPESYPWKARKNTELHEEPKLSGLVMCGKELPLSPGELDQGQCAALGDELWVPQWVTQTHVAVLLERKDRWRWRKRGQHQIRGGRGSPVLMHLSESLLMT